jgi:hypothetical protein
MESTHCWFRQSVTLFAAIGLFAAVGVEAQPVPRSLTVGANPPGTVFYALASGLAKYAGEARHFSSSCNRIPARARSCRY